MRRKHKVICLFIGAGVLLSACAHKSPAKQSKEPKEQVEEKVKEQSEKDEDYSAYFKDMEGGAVIFDSRSNTYHIYNRDVIDTQASPCSTFKIISGLTAVHEGIIEDEGTTLGYNGTVYPISKWNSDVTFEEAFRSSCVWYFRKATDAIGKEKMQSTLDMLSFGNRDMSQWEGSGGNPAKELNGFWIESSLLISPREWVNILFEIFEKKEYFLERDREILMNVMNRGEDGGKVIYGKTGSGFGDNAWFVGMTDTGLYYAVRITAAADKEVAGSLAEQTLRDILRGEF